MGLEIEFATQRGVAGDDQQLNKHFGFGRAALSIASGVHFGSPGRYTLETVRDAWVRARRRPAVIVLTIGFLAILLAMLLRVGPSRAPTATATVETTITMCGLAAAWLLRAQFLHSRRLSDLILLAGVLTLALMSFWLGALPAALEWRSAELPAVNLFGQLIVAGMFAAAALASSDRRVDGRRHPVAIAAAVSLLAVLIAELGGLLLHGEVVSGRPGAEDVLGHPGGAVLVIAAAALFACAAMALARGRIRATGIGLSLAVATILLAAASLYHLALTSVGPDTIAPREGLRVLAFVLILAAAVRQELEVRATMARAAAIAERQRMARDLHDGLAQDLAFIAAHGLRIAGDVGEDHPMVIAARRALAISRGAIADLSGPAGSTPREALDAIASELRARFQIAIAVDARVDHELRTEAKEHLSRIAREAIANAARHGGAKNVSVSLESTHHGVALRVVDDGRGILRDANELSAEGFGLRSMRERAAALGGDIHVRRAPTGGTELQVVLP